MSHHLTIHRYPSTKDKSLKASNAADDLILNYLSEENIEIASPVIFNDRFGYLSCHLNGSNPFTVINYKSQEKAIKANLVENSLPHSNFIYPFQSKQSNTNLALIKIPKSMELFRLFLHQAHQAVEEGGKVICGFMTKYFTSQMLEVASEYFEEVQQTKAWKKARLIVLSKKKEIQKKELIDSFEWNGDIYKQYLGVFSSGHIDYATQFFLEHLNVREEDLKVLDLASGNGVIARYVRKQNVQAEIDMVDDSWVAIESSKLNLKEGKSHFHFNDSLGDLEDNSFDLVVSNPPFHFDFEPNTEVSFLLFSEVKEKLKSRGRFEIVANRHLPYKPFLEKLFSNVQVVKQNSKYIIYRCVK